MCRCHYHEPCITNEKASSQGTIARYAALFRYATSGSDERLMSVRTLFPIAVLTSERSLVTYQLRQVPMLCEELHRRSVPAWRAADRSGATEQSDSDVVDHRHRLDGCFHSCCICIPGYCGAHTACDSRDSTKCHTSGYACSARCTVLSGRYTAALGGNATCTSLRMRKQLIVPLKPTVNSPAVAVHVMVWIAFTPPTPPVGHLASEQS